MPFLLLNEHDVQNLLTMDLALDAVADVLLQHARGEAQNIPRARCQSAQSMLHVMAGASRPWNQLASKVYSTSKQGAQFVVSLFGPDGSLEAMIQGDILGQMRTGATSGVATRILARPDACEVGVFGAGKQARTQLWAVSRVRKLRRVQVFSPSEERRRCFAEEMSALCHCDVEPVGRPQQAAQDKDIVITATSSRIPVLEGDWLAEGTHLNLVGSNFLTKTEIDLATARVADHIVVDSLDAARLEAGDFVEGLEAGVLRWENIHELGQVLLGRAPGRTRADDITLFKSVGLGIEDLAVARVVVERAKTAGVGRTIDW